MKKIIIIAIITVACFFTSCEPHEQWGDGRSDLEHTYVVMMDHPYHNLYFYTYQIDADGASRWRNNTGAAAGEWLPTDEPYIASIPVRLYSASKKIAIFRRSRQTTTIILIVDTGANCEIALPRFD